MQTTITVVNLIHDPKTDTDTPVCWVFPACSWRERIGSTGSGTAKDPAGKCTSAFRLAYVPQAICPMCSGQHCLPWKRHGTGH